MPTNNTLFKLTLPDEWKETTVYTFEGPLDNGLQHSLVFTILPGLQKNITIATYAKLQTEESAGKLPGFKLIYEKPVSFFDTIPGFEICYSYRATDEMKFMQMQWYFTGKDKVYLFTGTFTKKTIKTIGKEVESIVRTLRIIQSISDGDD